MLKIPYLVNHRLRNTIYGDVPVCGLPYMEATICGSWASYMVIRLGHGGYGDSPYAGYHKWEEPSTVRVCRIWLTVYDLSDLGSNYLRHVIYGAPYTV